MKKPNGIKLLKQIAVAVAIAFLTSPIPAESSTSESDRFDAELLRLTNAERAKAGVPPLQFSEVLDEAADLHAIDMTNKNYWSHTGADGSTPIERAQRAGYDSTFIGENIAINISASNAFAAWMSSDVHRDNILKENYTDIGFGYSPNRERRGATFVQVFGSGGSTTPTQNPQTSPQVPPQNPPLREL